MCHNMQWDVCLLFGQIKVTFYNDREGLLEPVYSLLTSADDDYGGDLSLRVTLASLPGFTKGSQEPAVWVRQDPVWLCNHRFPWEEISHVRKSSEWEGGNLRQWFGLGLWKRYVMQAKIPASLTFTWCGKNCLCLPAHNGQALCKWLSTKRCCSSGFLIVISILLDANMQKLRLFHDYK